MRTSIEQATVRQKCGCFLSNPFLAAGPLYPQQDPAGCATFYAMPRTITTSSYKTPARKLSQFFYLSFFALMGIFLGGNLAAVVEELLICRVVVVVEPLPHYS